MTLARAASALLSLPGRLAHAIVPASRPSDGHHAAAVRPPARRPRPPRRRALLLGAAGAATALVATAGTVPAAAAAGQPGGIYTGMGACPLSSAALRDPGNLQVGCVTSVTHGGSFTIGSTSVALQGPITLQFGVVWDHTAPVVTFPDGSTANSYTTVAPSGAPELSAPAAQITIPGIANVIPGVTSILAQVQQTGPITDFVPLATGENYPVFKLPVRLHLINALLGPDCYIGSAASPITLAPTTGTTSPPPPATPLTGDPGTINVASDPGGHQAIVASFSGASLVDNTFTVPGATGCGLGGILDPLIDLVMGLPAKSGKGSVTFKPTDTALALDPSVDDLTAAIDASRQ